MPIPKLSDTTIFTGGLALLAFVMALYTLAAREQKTPYIANSVYSTAMIVLAAIFSSTLGQFLNNTNSLLASILGAMGVTLLGCGLVLVFFRVWQAHNRRINFRDDHLLRNLKVLRWFKSLLRNMRRQPTYEHNPLGLNESLLKSIMQCLPQTVQLEEAIRQREGGDTLALSLSVGCRVPTFTEADHLLVALATCFLAHQYWVQYTTCTRHPIEFILRLKREWQSKNTGKDWKQVADHVVVADAYTPHFGFTDSIHNEMTKRLLSFGVECIIAKASYAGVHTAAARAFNKLKDRSKKPGGQQLREATLVIYDGPYALVELESNEQYRIFIRHVMPSERLWGGMFTLVVESVIGEQELALLKAYSDVFIDLSSAEGRPHIASGEIGNSQNSRTFPEKSESAGGQR